MGSVSESAGTRQHENDAANNEREGSGAAEGFLGAEIDRRLKYTSGFADTRSGGRQ